MADFDLGLFLAVMNFNDANNRGAMLIGGIEPQESCRKRIGTQNRCRGCIEHITAREIDMIGRDERNRLALAHVLYLMPAMIQRRDWHNFVETSDADGIANLHRAVHQQALIAARVTNTHDGLDR